MTSAADAKARLRAEMRARRGALDPAAAAAAAAELARRLRSLPELASAGRVAAYRAVRGEIALDGLISGGRAGVFTLPRVVGDELEFVAAAAGLQFAPGAFGILEPVGGEVVPLADHDAVLLPLVAFDARCRRLGQGGGFYDRALALLGPPATAAGPAAIGVAYSFQQVHEVPCEPWDARLDAVVTDLGVVRPDTGRLA